MTKYTKSEYSIFVNINNRFSLDINVKIRYSIKEAMKEIILSYNALKRAVGSWEGGRQKTEGHSGAVRLKVISIKPCRVSSDKSFNEGVFSH